MRIENRFINLKDFITKEFFERKIIIDVPNSLMLKENFANESKKWKVEINNDQILTLNFRLLYDVLPEILFLFCEGNNKKRRLTNEIIKINNINLDNSEATHFRNVIEITLKKLFEAIFFGNLFAGVWNGEEYSKRIFVFKLNKELVYVTIYQKFLLSRVLLSIMQIKISLIPLSNSMSSYCLKFLFDYNLFCKKTFEAMQQES